MQGSLEQTEKVYILTTFRNMYSLYRVTNACWNLDLYRDHSMILILPEPREYRFLGIWLSIYIIFSNPLWRSSVPASPDYPQYMVSSCLYFWTKNELPRLYRRGIEGFEVNVKERHALFLRLLIRHSFSSYSITESTEHLLNARLLSEFS